jgi:hypothetical protein
VVHQLAIALGAPRIQRLLQRVEHEVGLHGTADPPAHDATREHIDDEGDVHEALPSRHVGEVRHPQLVRSLGVEVPVDAVQRTRRLGVGHRRAHPLAATHPLQPEPPHQSLHRAACHRHAFAHELAPDLVGAVDLQVLVIHALHLRQQARVALGPRGQQRRTALARRAAPVRRWGNLQRAADRLDPEASAVLVDEGIHFL